MIQNYDTMIHTFKNMLVLTIVLNQNFLYSKFKANDLKQWDIKTFSKNLHKFSKAYTKFTGLLNIITFQKNFNVRIIPKDNCRILYLFKAIKMRAISKYLFIKNRKFALLSVSIPIEMYLLQDCIFLY